MSITPREKMEHFVAQQATATLRTSVRALEEQVSDPSPHNPEWIALMATVAELRRRAYADRIAASSRDLAALLREGMGRPSAKRDRLERLDFEVAEQIIRDRFPVADEATDDYLDALDPSALPDDEYAHLRVLLEAAGL